MASRAVAALFQGPFRYLRRRIGKEFLSGTRRHGCLPSTLVADSVAVCQGSQSQFAIQNPAPGVIDFDGLRDLEFAFKEAQRAGLLVVARPGPYVNAEVTGVAEP